MREIPLYLEDTVQNEESRILVSMLRYELDQYSQIAFVEGTPGKGDALLRIIHYPPFYEDHPEDDDYLKAPKDCIVQHVTVEDFQLTGMNRRGTREKEDHKLLKVIQELAIKIDINRRQMTCYDWPKLGFHKPVTFVTATSDYTDKTSPYVMICSVYSRMENYILNRGSNRSARITQNEKRFPLYLRHPMESLTA